MKSRLRKNNTVDLYEAHIRNHTIPTFGASGMASIRPTMMQQWVKNTVDQQVIIVSRHPALASPKTSGAILSDLPEALSCAPDVPRSPLPLAPPQVRKMEGGWVGRPVGRVLISQVRDVGHAPPTCPDLRMRSHGFSSLRGVSRAHVQPMCNCWGILQGPVVPPKRSKHSVPLRSLPAAEPRPTSVSRPVCRRMGHYGRHGPAGTRTSMTDLTL
jgi:Phage integrase, N-terminal SAM-like domain